MEPNLSFMHLNSNAASRSLWIVVAVGSLALSRGAGASERVALEDIPGGSPVVIGSMELYDNGLYWSVYGGGCGGEFSAPPSVAILGFRDAPFPPPHRVAAGCPPTAVGGMARDDAFAYFTTPGGLFRKPVGAEPSDKATIIGPEWGALTPGAIAIHNGRAYYGYSSPGAPIGGVGYFGIEYITLPGVGGTFASVVQVANGTGLPDVGRITKLGFMDHRMPNTTQLRSWGIALTREGYLLRFPTEPAPGFPPAVIMATAVTDFAIRQEQYSDAFPRRDFEQDTLYVAVGNSWCPADPPSQLVTLDPVSGERGLVWTAKAGQPPNETGFYISAIGLDQEYLFVSTFARQQLGSSFGGCQLQGAGVIRSKRWYSRLVDPGGKDSNWEAIELAAGANLRSDGHFLYFTRNNEVRRMPNDSPPVRQDFAALGLEAVQVVQDLANSIRLVEGKRTVVRAYARVVESPPGQDDWYLSAQLRGFLDGVELPGSPIFPLGGGRVTSVADYNILRTDPARSYQFELPQNWVQSGRLTLRFTVNPNLSTHESGGDPLANNTAEAANIPVVRVQPPCWAFASMHRVSAPNYWPWEDPDNFARFMERAKSLLPVPDIHVHPTTERVSHEYFCLRTCDGPLGIPIPCGFICNEGFDFGQSDDWNEALVALAGYDSFDQDLPGCGRTHYVGAIHVASEPAAWGGLGELGGRHFMAVMNPGVTSDAPLPWAGRTLAHEFGHNLGRRHVDQTATSGPGCGGSTPSDPDPAYPFDGCTLGPTDLNLPNSTMGFDMVAFAPVAPSFGGDLMSYSLRRWPSSWTYNAMLDALGATTPVGGPPPQGPPQAPPPPGPYLLVHGVVYFLRGQAVLKGCYSLPEGVADPGKVRESLDEAVAQAPHGYTLVKVDAAGAAIESSPVALKVFEDGDGTSALVSQFITKPAGMRGLQLVKNGVLLAGWNATPNTPVIKEVTALYDPRDPSVQVAIDASDADGDPLLFSLQFSNNNGATWRTLRVNEGGLAFAVNARFLPGGDQCLIRVIATDGFNGAVKTSTPFAVPLHAPEAFIGGVRAGERLPLDNHAALLGFALDAEEGSIKGAGLHWTLAGPTARAASGSSLSLEGLSPGLYTATLTATDDAQSSGVARLPFEILPLVIADGTAPVLDGSPSDTAYAAASVVRWPAGGRASARFLHSGTALYVCLTDLGYRGAGLSASYAGVRLDTDGSGDATAQGGDVGFFVDETGTPFQMAGDGTGMHLNGSPDPGFKAVVTRGVAGWNAEFRIPDSLLGGWNHRVRILLENSFLAVDDPSVTVWPPGAGRDTPGQWAPAWLGMSLPASANLPPVAKAGGPTHLDVNGPTVITLDGSASFDPEGGAISYAWTQVSGPGVALDNPAGPNPSFSFEAAASTTLRFRLQVSDGQLASTPAEVEVTLSPAGAQSVRVSPAATQRSDGSLEVSLQWPGEPGDLVIIEASADLTIWQTIATNTIGLMRSVLLREASLGTYPHRFYRLRTAPTPAAGTVVLNHNDSGPGSLREAIGRAAPGSTVTFAPNVLGTIVLTSGELLINKSLTLAGPGAAALSISGNHTSRVFHLTDGRVAISGLTLRDGLVTGSASGADGVGGGLFNGANALLSSCEITGNKSLGAAGRNMINAAGGAGGSGLGGGIYNTGTLALVNCTFESNEARGADGGFGGERNANAGYNGGAAGRGLGGAVFNDGVLGMTNCTLTSNQVFGAAGGKGGEGGLVQGRGGNGGNGEGAAVFNRQACVLMHVTIVGNAAERGPGGSGVPAGSPGTALGSGLRTTTATATLFNTLIAGNTITTGVSAENGPDVSGNAASKGFNLVRIGAGGAAWTANDLVGSNIAPLDPLVGPLQDNGGTTRTMALLPGSPAIDKGRGFQVGTDQRGAVRPFDIGSIPPAPGGDDSDIGAFEFGGP